MSNKNFITGIILASGFGRRAKCDKLMLDWQGKGLLFQVLKNALLSSLTEVILVIQQRYKDVCYEYKSLFPDDLQDKLTIVINEEAMQGMSASLRLGVEHADKRSQANLFLLADQIFFDSQAINEICNTFYQTKAEIIAPYLMEKRKNPVLFSAKYNQELLMLEKDLGARELLEKYANKIHKVYFTNSLIFKDIDTTEAYEELLPSAFSWHNFLKIKQKVSFIGAGGKTSLIWSIAKSMQQNHRKCIISTTTKMWNKAPDFVSISLCNNQENNCLSSSISELLNEETLCTPLLAKGVNSENKLFGFYCDEFDNLDFSFFSNSLLLIEADGAKSKSFKVHKQNEPSIPTTSDLVIAVIDISCIDKDVQSQTHRPELLEERLQKTTLSLEILQELLLLENGYFSKLAPYEHILFLNYKESEPAYSNALVLIKSLIKQKDKLPKTFKGFVLGSNRLNSYNFYSA